MSAVIQRPNVSRRYLPLWLIPVQALSVLTISAAALGGQVLRGWLLAGATWLLAMPLLVSLEAGLIAMMLFEPLRGLLRRAQYLFVPYSTEDPIHMVTPVVTMIAMIVLVRKGGLQQFWSTPLAGWVTLLAIIFFLEIFNPLQGSLFVGLSGALFVLVPLVWFYFGQAVNEKFIHTAMKVVMSLGILGSLYGLYQLMFGYPAFEQYWIENTDMYQSIAVGHVKRALATFSSAEEWGRYTEIGAIMALGFFAGAKQLRARIGWLICAAALLGGVLLSGQRTAIFGFMVGVVALIMSCARSWRIGLVRVGMFLIALAVVFVLAQAPTDDEVWSKAENERVSAVLTHTQRGTLKPTEEDSLQIRFENWGHLITSVIPYRPLGAGVGAGSLSDMRANRNSDLPPIDNFILVLGLTCGIPGALVFVWVLLRASWLSARRARAAESGTRNQSINRIAAALMPVLLLNSVFGMTFSIYSVAPLAWLLIGWVSAEAWRARENRENNEREVLII